ncbi:MAG: hypothetical protein V3W08_02300, partial [Candidatus Binatia bacterium]
ALDRPIRELLPPAKIIAERSSLSFSPVTRAPYPSSPQAGRELEFFALRYAPRSTVGDANTRLTGSSRKGEVWPKAWAHFREGGRLEA